MVWGNPYVPLLALLALLLVLAGIEDARTREIANWKNVAIAALAPLWWWAHGLQLWPDVAIQCAIAVVVFALFLIPYARGWMGGGDVKMIGALALWFVDWTALAWMLIVMSLVGGVLTLVMMLDRWRRNTPDPIEIPYGVAIAIAALFAIREPIINQFT